MENSRLIKLFQTIFIGGTLLVLPFFGFAYDDKTTHPALTQEIVKFFNQSFSDQKINDENIELIIQGSIDEDSGIRWMRHFYDPVYNRGLVSAGTSWISSKEWAENTKAQAGVENAFAGITKPFFSGEEDYSWDRAVYEYAWGNKDRGLSGLGHILHLLEDATVPDHTRNDPHPFGSPYEEWTKKFDRKIINLNSTEKPVLLSNLNSYFDTTALNSNNNFFSKDTILDLRYSRPTVKFYESVKLSNNLFTSFGYGAIDGNIYKLVRKDESFDWRKSIRKDKSEKYFITDDDDLILSDYWSLLSKQAVLNGAGVIKLFFDEAEKEKQTKTLYEKNRSWLNKQIDKFKSGVFNIASVLYGITATEKDLTAELPPTPQNSEPKKATTETPEPEPVLKQTAAIITPASTPASNISPAVTPEILTKPPEPAKPQISNETNSVSSGWSYQPSPDSNAAKSAPTPTPTPEPTPPPDPPPPNLLFTISECGQSFSSSTCLLATTTINLSWLSTSTDLKRYNLACELNNSACPNFNFASTTATSTIYNLSDNSSYIFKARAIDNAGNQSIQQIITVEINSRPVVINEIGWGGTSATKAQDEWIELYNPTFFPVNLSGLNLVSETDNGPNIQLSGTISPRGFYLIERTDDTTISDIIASTTASFGNGLNNSGEVLAVKYGSTTIDRTPALNLCGGWCAGVGNPQFLSMERFDPLSSGENQNNWGNWMILLPANGKNADGLPINGTPGRRNSINYLIDKSASFLGQNKTLKKNDSPYIIPSITVVIPSGITLNIEPGVVIKFYNGASSLTVNGIIKAEGTIAEPIIFTSFKDDSYGGDTNQDGASTTPQPGNWSSIKLIGNGSVFDRTIIRYGGLKDFSANYWANLKAENAEFTLKNSIIEESAAYGLWLTNASGAIETNVIRNNNQGLDSIGITAQDGSLNINNNTFTNNTFGLQLTSGGAAHSFTITNNTFSQSSQYPIRVLGAYPTFSGNTAANNDRNGINLQGSLNQDYTLTPDLPYVIQNTTYYIPAGKTLTILPGTIIKLEGVGSISISGKMAANGTAFNKIIFTSINDDDCGISGGCGDTNATTTLPAAGDWYNLSFLAGSASSTLNYVSVRYGGAKPPPWTTLGALRVKDSSIDIKNTLVDNNHLYGIWLENSTSTSIVGSTIKDHQQPLSGNAAGLYLTSSSPFIQNTTFENNTTGIQADGLSSVNNGSGIIFIGNTTNTIPAGLIP